MTALHAGLCLIHDGVPVQLVSLAETHDAGVDWWCKLLFVEPQTVLRTFRRNVAYGKLHTTFDNHH